MNDLDQTASSRHSEDWFGDQRDFWWNRDFLALMATRWQLGACRAVLDVGSGLGHWGRALAPFLAPEATLVGVERERDWVAEATKRAAAAGLAGRFSYVQGVAEQLPFADASFDAVTCQTVLMHLRDARIGIAEMWRVLKPGGIVIAVEPNNRAMGIAEPSCDEERPVAETLAIVRLQILCERGKAALGEGYNAMGERLPRLFTDAGYTDLQIYLADKAYAYVPPYRTADERARIACQADIVARRLFISDRPTCARYYAAAGGDAAEFAADWDIYLSMQRRWLEAMQAGTFASAGGTLCYVVSGRKPAAG